MRPNSPKLSIAVCSLCMILLCAYENVAGYQDEPAEITLEDYTRLIHRYRRGEHGDAARALARWNREQVNATVLEFRKRRLDAGQVKTAALLHTEIILLKLDESDFHLNHTRTWIRELEPPEREIFERRWLLMLGYFYMQSFGSGDTAAVQAAKKAFPDDAELHIAFGSLSETQGWMEHDDDALYIAETQFRIALDAEPDHPEALIRLGRVLTLTGHEKEALDLLARGLEKTLDARLKLAGLLSVGESRLRRGEIAEAIQAFRAALELDPACQTSVMALAMALHKAGDTQGSNLVIHEYFLPEENRSSSRASSGAHDLWWRYLLGNADRFESLLAELREETRL